MSLLLDNVKKRFPELDIEVSLSVKKGELLTLLGPSGCGKTTTLNIVAGFIGPESGVIAIDGIDVTGLPPHRRGIGFVFQDYALFPNMDVFGNIAFGLRMKGWSAPDVRARVRELVGLVRLERFERRSVAELSGGEQQRVALARALAPKPALLLLDEPLSALDAQLRKSLRGEIRRIQRQLGITAVYVTHDQEEALAISDRIAVMREGRIEQSGTPFEIYNRPATLYVAGFVGISNRIDGRVGARTGEFFAIESPEGVFRARAAGDGAVPPPGAGAVLLFRPEKCALERLEEHGVAATPGVSATFGVAAANPGDGNGDARARMGGPPPSAANALTGMVRSCEYLGDSTLLEVLVKDRVFSAKFAGYVGCMAGERVRLSFTPEDCWVLPAGLP